MTINYRQIPSTGPYPTGRNVKHDSRSLAYPFTHSRDITVNSVKWSRRVNVFDQGQIGDCTSNALQGALGTDPYFASIETLAASVRPTFTEGAVSQPLSIIGNYHTQTEDDDYAGTYPPDDTGSDGLTAATLAKKLGWCSGYTHILSGTTGFKAALQSGPV
jgi:hypothetical protein